MPRAELFTHDVWMVGLMYFSGEHMVGPVARARTAKEWMYKYVQPTHRDDGPLGAGLDGNVVFPNRRSVHAVELHCRPPPRPTDWGGKHGQTKGHRSDLVDPKLREDVDY